MNKVKLNIKRVTEVINDDYKKWKDGDVIKIQAQTGSGKTYFITETLIPNLNDDEKMLILVNRVKLKLQMKKELAEKYNVPYKDLDELNKKIKFGNIYISSYQALAEKLNDSEYTNESVYMDYDYIVCDEIHMITEDAWTGNTTCLWEHLIKEDHRGSKRIFISATMEELDKTINKCHEKNQEGCWGTGVNKIYEYKTGIDYSYIEPYYFYKDETLLKHIIQDKSDHKWLIFIANKSQGEKFKTTLEQYNITSEFIYSGSRSKENENIVNTNKFTCKVLITTSVLDNGVNIKDEQVKHVAIFTYSITNFIQSLGRVRFEDLNNVPKVNLYLPTFNSSKWINKLRQYNKSYEQYTLFINNYEEFKRKFNKHEERLVKGLFYLDKNDKRQVDGLRLRQLIVNSNYIEKIIEESKLASGMYLEHIFIKEQLKALNLDVIKYCNDERVLEEMEEVKRLDTLEIYINGLVNKLLDKDEQNKLVDMINLTDNRGRQQKKVNLLNEYLIENFNMQIISKRIRIDGNKTTVWEISEI